MHLAPVRCKAIARVRLPPRPGPVYIPLSPWTNFSLSKNPSLSLRATMSTSSVSSSTSASDKPQVPRPSASLIIVNERNEVLLVHRNPKATAFGGMHVFPGGNFDKRQDTSLSVTAIRETFEESGMLLASATSGDNNRSGSLAPFVSEKVLDEERFAIHQQAKNFQDFLSEHALAADVGALMPFMEWITPVGPPRRFRTQFFVTFLSASPQSGFSSGQKQERLPTPDGGQEVIAARFIHPSEALSETAAQKMNFMPPQFYILSTLADILEGPVNTAEQRKRVKTLSEGAFGRLVINPVGVGKADDGRSILAYEGDEARGGVKGRYHRSLVRFGKMPSDITLIRNFDIFTDIEPTAFNIPSAKL